MNKCQWMCRECVLRRMKVANEANLVYDIHDIKGEVFINFEIMEMGI